MSIPTYIVEEHNEAFYLWNYMRHSGQINQTGNLLLHVDFHDDFSHCSGRVDFRNISMDLQTSKFLAYNVFNICDFIVPAFFYGFFDTGIWVMNDAPGYHKTQRAIFCDAGNTIRDRIITDSFTVEQQGPFCGAGEVPADIYDGGMADYGIDCSQKKVVLDVDLDFFCCDSSQSTVPDYFLEVSPDVYNEICENPYHFIKMEFGGRIVPCTMDGHCLLHFEKGGVKGVPWESKEMVVNRMELFFAWLKRYRIEPAAIDIARSYYSGFVPRPMYPWLEDEFLQRLGSAYDIDIKCRPEWDD